MPFELSSMGIRVDEDALKRQVEITGDQDRLKLDWHQALLHGLFPLTIGGGIGQSRMAMFLLLVRNILVRFKLQFGQMPFVKLTKTSCKKSTNES